MIKVTYPSFPFKIKQENNKDIIFDGIRKKWLVLTPEEWVRQNFIQYLIQEKKYPSSLIAIEKTIQLNDLKKRCDIIVYKNEQPWMIVECKEMGVMLSEKTIQQILQYNIALPSSYLIITNGKSCFGWKIKPALSMLSSIPEYAHE
ncbi:MAG: type I restriction enzyme HsdR N-terminal domain-containing protein [Chitinophagaceae bacterium]